ncbi:MAG: hypothetical protein IPG73_02540 [Ignavibacteria bacterium]|nr:hypothetical protein [Ignavibacteria bacterium]
MRHILLSLLCGLLCMSSTRIPPDTSELALDAGHERSVFFWRTTLTIGSRERAMLDEMKVSTLYVRYLDVSGYSVSGARPVQPIQPEGELNVKGLSIVPTVFLDPDVLRDAHDSTVLHGLAYRLVRYLREIDTVIHSAAGIAIRPTFQRLLLDCDWTPSTRTTYFQFVQYVQALLPSTSVETTIRLWQYRHPSLAGIPPVKRGLLMCYNMDRYDDPWTDNAIASIEKLKLYVQTETARTYPLMLDVAYPTYRQTVYMQNNAESWRYARIIYSDLPVGRHTFTSDTMIADLRIGRGDVVRVDGGTADLLRAMHDHISTTIPHDRVAGSALFDLDTTEFERIGIHVLKSIYSE